MIPSNYFFEQLVKRDNIVEENINEYVTKKRKVLIDRLIEIRSNLINSYTDLIKTNINNLNSQAKFNQFDNNSTSINFKGVYLNPLMKNKKLTNLTNSKKISSFKSKKSHTYNEYYIQEEKKRSSINKNGKLFYLNTNTTKDKDSDRIYYRNQGETLFSTFKKSLCHDVNRKNTFLTQTDTSLEGIFIKGLLSIYISFLYTQFTHYLSYF